MEDEAPDMTLEEVTDRPSAFPGIGALADALSPFLLGAVLGETDQSMADLVFRRTFLVADDWRFSLGGMLLADPEIYEPLAMKLQEDLPEEGRDDAISDVEDQVERYQNLKLTLEGGYEGTIGGLQYGRDPSLYDTVLTAACRGITDSVSAASAAGDFAARLSKLPSLKGARKEDASLERAQALLELVTVDDVRSRFSSPLALRDDSVSREHKAVLGALSAEMDSMGGALKRELAQEVIDAFDETLTAARGAENDLKTSLQTVADLISNQPQIRIEASYNELQEVVGPDSVDFALRWEVSPLANINRLKLFAEEAEECGASDNGPGLVRTAKCIQA